jgi:hypothetical protein
VSAPEEQIGPRSAPNKANSAAPTKRISPRGARELARFVASQDRRGDQNVSWIDFSIDKR